MTLERGDPVGDYVVDSFVARGGMGEVYRGRPRAGGDDVAIKVIRQDLATSRRHRRMFLDEGRISSRLLHPAIARTLACGEEESGRVFLVIEWLEGPTLEELLALPEPLPRDVVVRILIDVAEGLHAAHEQRDEAGRELWIVHRDVSPQNVLVTLDGHAKLLDFGIARARDRVAEQTRAGLVKGKLAYMAPEQAVGRLVDRRADVWSLGALLHHAVVGSPPCTTEADVAAMLAGKSSIAAGHDGPVAVALAELLAIDRDRRTRDAARAAQLLRAISAPASRERVCSAIQRAPRRRSSDPEMRTDAASPTLETRTVEEMTHE